MNRLSADPIERICEFALTPVGKQPAAVRQGIPSPAASFNSSRKSSGERLRPRVAATERDAEPSEREMCRLAQPYGFVIRIDGDARSRGEPFVKLFRFDDRRKPVRTFGSLAQAAQWLAKQTAQAG